MAYRYVPPALRAKGQGGSNTNDSSSRNANTSMPADPTSSDLRSGGSSHTPGVSTSSKLRGGEGSNWPPRRRSEVMPDEETYSLKEIDHYFWPEEESKPGLTEQSKTLHDSAATPGMLAYVLLFKDANPRWDSDGIVFTKSSLDLLPAELTNKPDTNAPASKTAPTPSVSNDQNIDSTSTSNDGPAAQEYVFHKDGKRQPEDTKLGNLDPLAREHEPIPPPQQEHQPIAIFMQPAHGARSYQLGHRCFKFSGYYRITHLQFLEPNTPELARMLKQKWTITNQRTGKVRERQRDAQSWEKSFNLRWAVVKFEKDETANKKLGKPRIERVRDDQEDNNADGAKEKKSVNDLLRELRMENGRINYERVDNGGKAEENVAADGDRHANKEMVKENVHGAA